MKANKIKNILSSVIASFTNNMLTPIAEIVNRGYITGGAIPSMLMDEWVNDYDIYLRSKEDAEKLKELLSNWDKDNPDNNYLYINNENLPFGHEPISGTHKISLITDNAVNLANMKNPKEPKIQIILGFYGEPESVVTSFDWKHIKSYYNIATKELIIPEYVYRLIVEKELIYTGSHYPLSSLIRIRKYIKKGWNISAPMMAKVAYDFFFDTLNRIDKENDIAFSANPDDYNNDGFEYPCNVNGFPDFSKVDVKMDVDDVIYQFNGMDPIEIRYQLEKHTGERMNLREIINLINQ